MPLKKNLHSSLDKDFRFYIASNPSPNPTPNYQFENFATSKLPSRGDPGLPRTLPALRERKVSPHRRRKRGRRAPERDAARRLRMKSRRQMNRQCFRVFKRQLPPWKLGLVAAQPPVVATQETQGQRLNKPSVRPHITFQNGRRKLKLLLQQRQAVSPKIKNQLQGKLESLAEKLPYGRTLKIGSCNVQGLKITDRQNLIKTMMAQHLDIMCLQETHINHCKHRRA